jgi:hypothetical protein
MIRKVKRVRKIEQFVAYDAVGGTHPLEIWQFSVSATATDDPHTADALNEVLTVDGRPVKRISDDEFVIPDSRFPGGLTVRRR